MAVRLMLVDDDPVALEAISHTIRHYLPAVTIETCVNPVSALLKLRGEPFAVVLSDFNMPDMNGLRLLQGARECGSEASFIVMTADATEDILTEGLRLGMFALLPKPFNRAALIPMVQQAIECNRHRQEVAALRDSEERLALAQRSAQIGTWDLNLVTGSLFWSEEHYGIYGVVKEQISPSYDMWLQHVHPNDRDRMAEETQVAIESDRMIAAEFRIVRQDGKVCWVIARGNVHRDEQGRPIRLAGITFDVTDRKDAEEALRQERATLHAVITSLVQGVCILDKQGTVMTVNPAALQLLGCTDQEEMRHVLGRRVWSDYLDLFELRYPDGHEVRAEDCPLSRALLGEQVSNFEVCVRKRDSERTWIGNFGATPLYDHAGIIMMVVITIHDITERKRHDEMIHNMNHILEEQVKARTSELLMKQQELRCLAQELSRIEERERKALARDLHDNLAQLLALCKMRLEGVRIDPAAAYHTTRADAVGLLNDALTYVRTLMSNLSPSFMGDEHDLLAAISWVAEKMQRHGLALTVSDDGKEKVLHEEVLAFTYRSIHELVFNVLKHAETKSATVALRRVDGYLEATVSDCGVGFDTTMKRTPGRGGGFGLFTIAERAEQLGGHFEMTSELGHGTCAKVVMPLKGMTGTPRSPYSMTVTHDAKIRVLLVDDHAMIRQGLRHIIEGESDFVVIAEAADGETAVKLAARMHPDVIIMDVYLPTISGIEATQHIKALSQDSAVIGLSFSNSAATAASMRRAGASAYFSKGDSFDELAATIRACSHGK